MLVFAVTLVLCLQFPTASIVPYSHARVRSRMLPLLQTSQDASSADIGSFAGWRKMVVRIWHTHGQSALHGLCHVFKCTQILQQMGVTPSWWLKFQTTCCWCLPELHDHGTALAAFATSWCIIFIRFLHFPFIVLNVPWIQSGLQFWMGDFFCNGMQNWVHVEGQPFEK